MSSPSVVFVSKFVEAKERVFSSYIDYIDRDEATRAYKFDEFSLYNDYMGNPEKLGSLFTSDKDYLTDDERNSLKDKFRLAQKNGSLMWQDVFSFDNEWLIEHGYYDEESHILDEEKIRGAVRRSMNNHLDKSNMDTAIWSASFHYNTDNIHVHIATVELTDNPRKRGKRTKSELGKMKSNFINELRHREKEYQKINELIRENIIKDKEKFLSSDDKILKEKTLELLKKLPTNKKYWQYGYNKINNIRPLIDGISKYYIETYHKEDYTELMKRLTIEELELKRVYGEGQEGKEKDRYKDYKKNKEKELLKRMGNSILKELKDYVKEEEEKNKNKREKVGGEREENFKRKFKIEDEKLGSDKKEREEYKKKEGKKENSKENFRTNKENINSSDGKKDYDFSSSNKNGDSNVNDIFNRFSEENLLKISKNNLKINLNMIIKLI
ncbi:relaxase MobL [Clostridium sp. DSM 100503]|uniref:MobP2 family relaxase n=1 Tax=Clostridium sp. DSM 100503 TaxID=2963282 RepID=UPI00214A03B0|nr:MobP2 family relaxase [Clostridium sp. DSM 100503]MCR1952906.1 relaxase MobL [Clostridium sp. DSM 100503]